jgi:DNA-binding transcriptional LysR family regulator
VTLLTRTSRRVELTSAGESLLRDGTRLLAEANRVIDRTRRAGTDTLTVGFYGSAAAVLLPPILRSWSAAQPAAEVSVRELLLGDLDDLTHGGVDLAFTRLHPDQVAELPIEVEVLAEEPRLLALSASHRLADAAEVSFGDLWGEDFVVNPAVRDSPLTRWRAEQRRHGLPGRVAARAASLQELLTFVAAGRGVSLVAASVSELHPRPDVRYVPVGDADPALVTLAWARGELRPAGQAFIAIARREAAQVSGPAGWRALA